MVWFGWFRLDFLIGERYEMGGWLEDGKGGSNSNTPFFAFHDFT